MLTTPSSFRIQRDVHILASLLLHAAGACATLNLATFDSGVDLDSPAIAPYVAEGELREMRYSASDLWTLNRRSPEEHGTVVAATLMQDLPADRARLIPIVESPPKSSWRTQLARARYVLKSATPRPVRRALFETACRRDFAALSRLLSEHEIRILNFSVSTRTGGTGHRWIDRLGWLQTGLRLHNACLADLVRRHPETLFVFAVGNESLEVAEDWDFAVPNAGEPNVLIVGAAAPGSEVAPYSNYSARFVDVLACGRATGLTGTSIAAPHVANAVAVDLLEHPDLGIAEARARFLARACLKSERLVPYAVDGRHLPGETTGAGVASTLPFLYEGEPSETNFRAALDRPSGGDLVELLGRDQGAFKALAEARATSPASARALEALRLAPVIQPPLPTRARLRRAFLKHPGPFAIVPYSRDGRALKGVIVRDGEVTPIDHPSTTLVPLVREIWCEASLIRRAV